MIFSSAKNKRKHQVSIAEKIIREDLLRLYQWMGVARKIGEGEYPPSLREDYRRSMGNFLIHLGNGINRLDRYVPELDLRELKSAYNSLEGEYARVFS